MKKLFSVKAAAVYLERTEKAIRRLEEKGLLKRAPLKDGRVMFFEEELNRFKGFERHIELARSA